MRRPSGTTRALFAATLSTQSAGVATLPAGHTLRRASDASAWPSAFVGGNDRGRIVARSPGAMLLVEKGATSLLSTAAVSSWSTSGTVATITGPDGASAYHVTDAAGQQTFTTFTDVKGAQTFSVWAEQNASTLFQYYLVIDGATTAKGSTTLLTSSYVQQTVTASSATGGNAGNFAALAASVDQSAHGGINASALTHNCNVQYPQVEAGSIASSPIPSGGRADEWLEDTTTAAQLNGHAHLSVTWCPAATPAQFIADGRTRLRIAGFDALNCVEVDVQAMTVRAVVNGVPSRLSGTIPTWSGGLVDTLAFSIRQWGSGTPSGSVIYTPGGGSPSTVSLGTGNASLDYLWGDVASLYWFGHPIGGADPTSGQQLQGGILSYGVSV